MKKIFFAVLAWLMAVHFAAAQAPELIAKTSEKGLYLEHKVAPKESFFSVGRTYGVHPKFIASYNKLDLGKGLAIGQVVRIPLSDSNFTQKSNKGTPVYYKVGENEGLMKVSSLHNNVTLETLRNWNRLPDNSVKQGDKLIVGFLSGKGVSATTNTVATTTPRPPEQKEKTEPKKEEVKPEPVVDTRPEVKEKEKEKEKADPPITQPTVTQPVFAKQEEKPASSESGYFKYYFDQQVKQTPIRRDETVTSGIFKTTSGWLDSKYYLLIDGVQPGTIIRIVNPSNNKIIYAKVLGEMSGIRQNEGLNIRISSAGAAALQVTEQDKFIVKVVY
jgi:hypothetical protein